MTKGLLTTIIIVCLILSFCSVPDQKDQKNVTKPPLWVFPDSSYFDQETGKIKIPENIFNSFSLSNKPIEYLKKIAEQLSDIDGFSTTGPYFAYFHEPASCNNCFQIYKIEEGRETEVETETRQVPDLPNLVIIEPLYSLEPKKIYKIKHKNSPFSVTFQTQSIIELSSKMRDIVLMYGPPSFTFSGTSEAQEKLGSETLPLGIFKDGDKWYEKIIASVIELNKKRKSRGQYELKVPNNVKFFAVGVIRALDLRDEDGVFNYELFNLYIKREKIPPTRDVEFKIAIPHNCPPEGCPVVIYGHGLGGSNIDVFNLSGEFAERKVAIAGISFLGHRKGYNPSENFDFNNVKKTREKFLQTVADMIQFENWLYNTQDIDSDGVIDIDKNKINYFGGSFGGIMGAIFMTLSLYSKTGVLNVPGSRIPTALVESRVVSAIFIPIIQSIVGATNEELTRFFIITSAIWQIGFDKADPANFARFLRAFGKKGVLIQKAVGDGFVPNRTTDFLARSYGIINYTIDNIYSSDITTAAVEYYPEKVGLPKDADPHDTFARYKGMMFQMFDYILSEGKVVKIY